MPDLDHLRAEANDLYARARQIEDQDERLIVISQALELEMAAEAQVIRHQRGADRDSA
jgi:hypothetical protein